MTAIVCVSQSWGIGRDGALLFRISADHKRFRALTVGKTVILGHKTLDTFPGGKPLKDRRNIVLSHRDLDVPGAEIAHSFDEGRRARRRRRHRHRRCQRLHGAPLPLRPRLRHQGRR